MHMFGLEEEQIRQVQRDLDAVPVRDHIRQIFGSLQGCSKEEIFCLQYLYAYMPAADIATYDVELFLKSVKDTLAAVRSVPWGSRITGELFFNYVLPHRINNEDLVDYREQLFNELYPRIKDLSMKDAILEVNYWCLEKATYKTTDMRTSSPLGVIRNAFGRCGEESVLCVAALRSVGIPARQCFTPRWAHCDDNHAWVEAWADGEWHFIGACEPEPVLDKGWFTESAKRGMLILARVPSRLVSDEHVTHQTPIMSQVNIMNNYAKTKKLRVFVTDEEGRPLDGAEVRFELINYSELFPLAVLKTDSKGEACLMTGFGDLFVHVSKDGRFVHKKADQSCLELHFSMAEAKTEDTGEFELDLVPPPQSAASDPGITPEMAKLHEERVARANELRSAFESTFMHGEAADKFAGGFSEYGQEIKELVASSNGNHREIAGFLQEDDGLPLKYKVMLLKSLRKKDLSDITCSTLRNHLKGALEYQKCYDEDLFVRYILCPWVYYEFITDYRSFINGYFDDKLKEEFCRDPRSIQRYITENISDSGDRDYGMITASPEGLLKLKYGSAMSRKILFVAICRTLGIPARMNEIDRKIEYWKENEWHTIDSGSSQPVNRCCSLILRKKAPDIPFAYEKNFTVARLENGVYHTLGLYDIPFEGDSLRYTLEEGHYRITTANRLRDGSILAAFYHTELRRGEEREVVIDLREPDITAGEAVALPQMPVLTLDKKPAAAQKLLRTGISSAIAFIEEGMEPTEHLLNEILEQKADFAREHDRVLLILKGSESLDNPLLRKVKDETGVLVAFRDDSRDAFDAVLEALNTQNCRLPLVIGLDEDGNCVFHISGYNVGTGDMLLRHFRKKSV